MRGTLRRAAAAMLATGLVAALIGCVAIPGEGKVQAGLTDLQQAEQPLQFNAPGPSQGASQEDLARGFVLAAASSADDYAVAREFLTADYARQWDPTYGVLIDEGARPFKADGEHAGVMSLAATSRVDAAGNMLPVEPGATTDLRFEFEQVAGQWRIASAPAGIILDKSTFMAIWSSHQLYFVGPGSILVPETRWFLSRATLATEIVGELIEGPSEIMREVLHSGFPIGSTLVSKSVPVVEGRAQIDMSSELLDASPKALSELRQQLKLSLQSVPGTNAFDLLVDGTPLRDQPGTPPVLVTETSVPAVVVDGKLGTVSGSEFTPMGGAGDVIGELKPKAAAIANSGERIAVLNKQGVFTVDAEGQISEVHDARPGLIAPSIDIFGYLWTATSRGELRAYAEDGTFTEFPAPWLNGRKVKTVRIAPDGSRIAALVESEFGAQVLLGGVLRDELNAPVQATAEADTVFWSEGSPIDLDWVGPVRLAMLSEGTGVGSSVRVTSGGPGLFVALQGSVQGGTTIAGGGARAQLRVATKSGELFSPLGGGWQRVEMQIDLLAKRG